MRGKRRIYVRDFYEADTTTSLDRERSIIIMLKQGDNKPDIVLCLESYMAAHLLETIAKGLGRLKQRAAAAADDALAAARKNIESQP